MIDRNHFVPPGEEPLSTSQRPGWCVYLWFSAAIWCLVLFVGTIRDLVDGEDDPAWLYAVRGLFFGTLVIAALLRVKWYWYLGAATGLLMVVAGLLGVWLFEHPDRQMGFLALLVMGVAQAVVVLAPADAFRDAPRRRRTAAPAPRPSR